MKKLLFLVLVFMTATFNNCSVKDMALDKKNMDTSIDPGDNFYLFANGGWLEKNPLPDEYSRYGSFDILAEENQKIVRSLVEEASASEAAEGSISRKVGDFFKSGMDTLKIEEYGIKPLSADFDLLKNVTRKEEIQNILFGYHLNNNQVLFYFFGAPDRKNSKMVIANLYQGGLGLTDVDYYTSDDSKAREIRKKYREYISDMLELAGIDDSRTKADIIFGFEERLARASMTRLERRDPHKTYNKMTVKELEDLCPQFNWMNYFSGCGLKGIEEINVSQPLFFVEIGEMLEELSIEDWTLYLKWHLINNAAPYLSSDFLNRNFEFYGSYLSGKKVLQPTWKRVLRTEDYALGEAIGQMFVEKYFPPESKARMLELVGNLKLALGERIDQLDWMSQETKNRAQEKLQTMNVKIGYPDKWRDYSSLHVGSDSYFDNIRRAGAFNFRYEMSKIGKEVDPDEWGMTPQTVNAYYSPSRNEIVFPAGILQPPFFYPDGDDAVNYGAIGVVIGHEMTHGFDDQGRQFDKDGNLTDWWTEEDSKKFKERAEVLVNQFNNFNVTDSVKANGQLTLGENIADLGGLNVAYTAVQKAWTENPPEKKVGGYTPEQRFFLAYAHVWAGNITEQEMLRRTKEDVHSLGNLRVNGPLPNLSEFYSAWNIDENSELFIPEDKRASIW